ncbi:hypothetical protein [Paenibacillus sp. RC84]
MKHNTGAGCEGEIVSAVGSYKPIEASERQARKKGVDSKTSIPVGTFLYS